MKVLYFHQHFSTPKGSTGIRSYAMAKHLVEQRHEVTMVCGSYSGGHTGLTGSFCKGRRQGMVDGIQIIEFNLAYSNDDGFVRRSSLFLLFALRSIGLALTERYDVLFATSTPLTAGIPGIFARWFRGKPFVFEVRDLWPELPREMGVIKNPVLLGLMSWLEGFTYRSAHRLIGLSPGIRDGIAKRGINIENIAMIPNGCDLSIFSISSHGWLPEGVNPDDLLAVFSGTHGTANGLEAVLDAAVQLKKRNRDNIKIVLIGQGRLKPSLQRTAEQKQLNNVIFLPPVDKQALSSLLASSSVGLQILANVPAFYFGTSPNKFFDYIAAGLPVLVNYPGWLAEMIVEHQCGFVTPPENAPAFADALETAVDNPEQLKQMASNARTLAINMFNRQDLAEDFSTWLEKSYKQ